MDAIQNYRVKNNGLTKQSTRNKTGKGQRNCQNSKKIEYDYFYLICKLVLTN